jgi:phosphoribosyl 1,2-cyclic phosphodiesterase
MKIDILASGSKGNSVHLECGGISLLIDAGLSCKQLEQRMANQALDPSRLAGILITHEHTDHIAAVSVLSRRYQVPVYVANRLWNALFAHNPNWYEVIGFEPGSTFSIGPISIAPFRTSHDAIDPVSFTFSHDHVKFGMVTDCGVATENVKQALVNCDGLLIESNHDEQLLKNGPYSYSLKSRISSNRGHLSNIQASNLLKRLISPRLKAVMLGHLSEENNTPELALRASKQMLRYATDEISLAVANQHEVSPTVRLTPWNLKEA